MLIDEGNTRRFHHVDGKEVLAIYDQNRSWTKYAAITVDRLGRLCFDMSTVRAYWDDEIVEIL